MQEAFALQSFSHFSTKNIAIFEVKTFDIWTKHKLMTSLVLNNRALIVDASHEAAYDK